MAAHAHLDRPDIGLILVGPDSDGILTASEATMSTNWDRCMATKKSDLLSAADVYCIPGAVGLSIVDAFHCGLPLVTEEGDESAEMMYLKDGRNGFIVPRGDIPALADKLLLLLDNDELRKRFSNEARREISENGHIDKLCEGFRDALLYATGRLLPRGNRGCLMGSNLLPRLTLRDLFDSIRRPQTEMSERMTEPGFTVEQIECGR